MSVMEIERPNGERAAADTVIIPNGGLTGRIPVMLCQGTRRIAEARLPIADANSLIGDLRRAIAERLGRGSMPPASSPSPPRLAADEVQLIGFGDEPAQVIKPRVDPLQQIVDSCLAGEPRQGEIEAVLGGLTDDERLVLLDRLAYGSARLHAQTARLMAGGYRRDRYGGLKPARARPGPRHAAA